MLNNGPAGWVFRHMKTITQDPRYFQILTLSILLGIHVLSHDFAPDDLVVVLTLITACITQIACSAVVRLNHIDLRSALITGLSLSILFKAAVWWLYPLAALIGIASKFTLRLPGTHIFNPANFAIVAMLLLFPDHSWVSTGQWGSSVLLGFLILCCGFLVLHKVPRWDMGPIFLLIWTVLIFGRALWLGDPLSIPVHQLHSGALLIFSFFMISDPKTIPDHVYGRVVFALAVALIAFILQFVFQVRAGLFYALVAVCMTRPVLDRVWPGKTFVWQSA